MNNCEDPSSKPRVLYICDSPRKKKNKKENRKTDHNHVSSFYIRERREENSTIFLNLVTLVIVESVLSDRIRPDRRERDPGHIL